LLPVSHGVATQQGGAAPPANPAPSLVVNNVGPTLGTGIVAPGALGAVNMIPYRGSIATNNGDTLQCQPTVVLAGGATIASDTITMKLPNLMGISGRFLVLSGHLGGADADGVVWVNNPDPTTFGLAALDGVLATTATINVAASLAFAPAIPTDIYLQLFTFSAASGYPPPFLASTNTVDLEYHVTDSYGNSGTSAPITLTMV
tara:strand:+ start:11632 stop:12240 length:609 start_codon:yes stop_codon:yes gene_type:complete